MAPPEEAESSAAAKIGKAEAKAAAAAKRSAAARSRLLRAGAIVALAATWWAWKVWTTPKDPDGEANRIVSEELHFDQFRAPTKGVMMSQRRVYIPEATENDVTTVSVESMSWASDTQEEGTFFLFGVLPVEDFIDDVEHVAKICDLAKREYPPEGVEMTVMRVPREEPVEDTFTVKHRGAYVLVLVNCDVPGTVTFTGKVNVEYTRNMDALGTSRYHVYMFAVLLWVALSLFFLKSYLQSTEDVQVTFTCCGTIACFGALCAALECVSPGLISEWMHLLRLGLALVFMLSVALGVGFTKTSLEAKDMGKVCAAVLVFLFTARRAENFATHVPYLIESEPFDKLLEDVGPVMLGGALLGAWAYFDARSTLQDMHAAKDYSNAKDIYTKFCMVFAVVGVAICIVFSVQVFLPLPMTIEAQVFISAYWGVGVRSVLATAGLAALLHLSTQEHLSDIAVGAQQQVGAVQGEDEDIIGREDASGGEDDTNGALVSA